MDTVIDANCMVGEYLYHELRFKTPDSLIREMDRLGIRQALVFDSRAWLYDPAEGNRLLLESVAGQQRLIPVMVLTALIEEEFGGAERLVGFIREHRIGAVRLFPYDHGYTLQPWNVRRLFSVLQEIHMPVLLEGRGLSYTIDDRYDEVSRLARAFPQVPLILVNTGYRTLRILYSLLDRCANVFLETSTFIVFHGIEEIVRLFGSSRLVFGSRMPFCEGGAALGRLIYASIDEEAGQDIAHRNIRQLIDRLSTSLGGVK